MAKMYSGSGRHFQEIQSVSLDHEGLGDIQQRIKLQPHFLGEQLIVIGETSDYGLKKSDHSYELLALDALGRAVTVSVVIGVADSASQIDSRALQMASHVAALDAEELGKIALEFISRPVHDPIRRVWDELGVEMSDESVELSSLLAATFSRDASDYTNNINQEQRIIIAAEGFTASMVEMVNWLVARGVDIMGLRYQKYLVGGQEIFFAEQAVPMRDPAIDAKGRLPATHENLQPWRVRGRQFHIERLSPSIGSMLDTMLITLQDSVFSTNWSHKYYFWLRGPKHTLRIRTYYRDRIEIGFHNISEESLTDFLEQWGLGHLEVYTIGGYSDSPFFFVNAEILLTDKILNMLKAWLDGAPPPIDKPIL